MSVLFKELEMPRHCNECPMYDGFGCCMYSLGIPSRYDYNPDNIPEWCKVIEVPTPHGRLIDADILTERFENLAAQALDYVGKLNEQEGNHELWRRWSTIWAERSAYTHDLYDAPTVIESEKRDVEQERKQG